MKVDMSPEAVAARLKLMDELWELGTELQAAGAKLKQAESKENVVGPEVIFVEKEVVKEQVSQDL